MENLPVSWGVFTGEDKHFPVEMFLNVVQAGFFCILPLTQGEILA